MKNIVVSEFEAVADRGDYPSASDEPFGFAGD